MQKGKKVELTGKEYSAFSMIFAMGLDKFLDHCDFLESVVINDNALKECKKFREYTLKIITDIAEKFEIDL